MEHALQNGPLSLTACTRYMVAAATQKFQHSLPDDALQPAGKVKLAKTTETTTTHAHGDRSSPPDTNKNHKAWLASTRVAT
jgi:hypothetical protein